MYYVYDTTQNDVKNAVVLEDQERAINYICENINAINIKEEYYAYELGHAEIICPILNMKKCIPYKKDIKLDRLYEIKEGIESIVINLEQESFEDCVIFVDIIIPLLEADITTKHTSVFYIFTEKQYTESLL